MFLRLCGPPSIPLSFTVVRSPRFRASASVLAWYAAFAIGVLRDIYAFHRYTTHSAYLYHTLVYQFQRHASG